MGTNRDLHVGKRRSWDRFTSLFCADLHCPGPGSRKYSPGERGRPASAVLVPVWARVPPHGRPMGGRPAAAPCPRWRASLFPTHPGSATGAKSRFRARIVAVGSALQCRLLCAHLCRPCFPSLAGPRLSCTNPQEMIDGGNLIFSV